MPKASAEATLKIKIQARALFELGKYTQEEICEAIKKSGGALTRKTLAKWINEDANDVWKVRDQAENRIYDAQKIVQNFTQSCNEAANILLREFERINLHRKDWRQKRRN